MAWRSPSPSRATRATTWPSPCSTPSSWIRASPTGAPTALCCPRVSTTRRTSCPTSTSRPATVSCTTSVCRAQPSPRRGRASARLRLCRSTRSLLSWWQTAGSTSTPFRPRTSRYCKRADCAPRRPGRLTTSCGHASSRRVWTKPTSCRNRRLRTLALRTLAQPQRRPCWPTSACRCPPRRR